MGKTTPNRLFRELAASYSQQMPELGGKPWVAVVPNAENEASPQLHPKAIYKGLKTRGGWGHPEQKLHVDYLEVRLSSWSDTLDNSMRAVDGWVHADAASVCPRLLHVIDDRDEAY